MLKIHQHDRLKRLRFPVSQVRPVAPLLDCVNRGGCEGRIAFDDSCGRHIAVLVDDRFENHCALDFAGTGSCGISGLHGMHQPFARALRRENDRRLFTGQLALRWTLGGGVVFAICTALPGRILLDAGLVFATFGKINPGGPGLTRR